MTGPATDSTCNQLQCYQVLRQDACHGDYHSVVPVQVTGRTLQTSLWATSGGLTRPLGKHKAKQMSPIETYGILAVCNDLDRQNRDDRPSFRS